MLFIRITHLFLKFIRPEVDICHGYSHRLNDFCFSQSLQFNTLYRYTPTLQSNTRWRENGSIQNGETAAKKKGQCQSYMYYIWKRSSPSPFFYLRPRLLYQFRFSFSYLNFFFVFFASTSTRILCRCNATKFQTQISTCLYIHPTVHAQCSYHERLAKRVPITSVRRQVCHRLG